MNSHTILLDIRRDIQAGQEVTGGQTQSVSTIFCCSATTHLLSLRLKPGQCLRGL